MASRELEVTVSSAKDLKNVNWRYGPLRPAAVLWVDGSRKLHTIVDDEGDTAPVWNNTFVIPLPPGRVKAQTLYIKIVHVRSDSERRTKPLIGSAKLQLRDVIKVAGYGKRLLRSLHLKRPSGRPHGKLEVKIAVKGPASRLADPNYAPPYGVKRRASKQYLPPYSTTPSPYYSLPQPSGYPYAAPPPPWAPYVLPIYGQPSYDQNEYAQAGKPKSNCGMGTRLAVVAVVGALGGLALAALSYQKHESKVGSYQISNIPPLQGTRRPIPSTAETRYLSDNRTHNVATFRPKFDSSDITPGPRRAYRERIRPKRISIS